MTTRVSEHIRVILAPNPGPMSLEGTNTYLLGADDRLVVVDPGPDMLEHVDAVAGAGRVELILITHHHADHTEASAALHARTGAPVRAADAAFCHGGEPLVDGEIVEAGGAAIRVLATPGHTADSVSFVVDGEDVVLTGDTVLGRGTTVLIHGDGSLADYLDSLDRLSALGSVRGLPGHGSVLPDLAATCARLRAHRLERLEQIRVVVAKLGSSASVGSVTDAVYGDADPAVRFAAEESVATQLEYLREQG